MKRCKITKQINQIHDINLIMNQFEIELDGSINLMNNDIVNNILKNNVLNNFQNPDNYNEDSSTQRTQNTEGDEMISTDRNFIRNHSFIEDIPIRRQNTSKRQSQVNQNNLLGEFDLQVVLEQ